MQTTMFTIRSRFGLAALCALLLFGPATFAQDADHPSDQPLRMAADVGFAPFAMTQPNGETVGFAVDACNEIASRLGRPGCEIVDVNFSAIFSGLFSGRFEGIIAPTNITHERAQEMLFTEGYMETGLGFVMKEDATLESLEELQGKVVAVNNGSVSDTWATANAEQYGFTVQRFDKNADGVQAVMTNRAFANIADLPAAQYAATQNPRIKVGHVVYTGNNFGYVFRKDDVEFRNRVERIVEAMKLDGTFARIHEEWFGDLPGEDTAMNKVWVGYGPPGYQGYTFEPHAPGNE